MAASEAVRLRSNAPISMAYHWPKPYIDKPHPDSPHEHITHIGNPLAGWKWPRERVIKSIDDKSNTFYVLDPYNGKRSNVGVVRPIPPDVC